VGGIGSGKLKYRHFSNGSMYVLRMSSIHFRLPECCGVMFEMCAT